MSAGALRQFRALLVKDLRLELHTRETGSSMVLFAVAAMVIFQFAIGTRTDETTPFAGGILWATLAFTAVLGVGRTYAPEREQGVLDGLLAAPVSRMTLMVSKAVAIACYMLAVEVVAVPVAGIFFLEDAFVADLGLLLVVCLLANAGIGILGALFGSMSLFSRARELVLPVLFLPAIVPVVIAAAGATHAVAGVSNDMAEYRGFCLFLAVYALVFGLVAYATYPYVFDD